MLAGVLLHVIEAPRPVDLAVCFASWLPHSGLLDDVHDRPVVFVDDVEDARSAEKTGVKRLAARGGIERCAIEADEDAAVAFLDPIDRRVKRP